MVRTVTAPKKPAVKAPAASKKTAGKVQKKTTSTKTKRAAEEDEAPPSNVIKGRFGRPVNAAGKSKTTAKRKPPKKFVYKARSKELKPCFLELGFATGKDGLIDPHSDATFLEAIKGSLTNEKAPHYDLIKLDPVTAVAVFTRLSYRAFAANPDKRFAPNQEFLVTLRLSVSRADNSLRARVKDMSRLNAKGKFVEITDKKDPEARKIRMCGRYLAGAFINLKDMEELKELNKELEQFESQQEGAEDEDAE